MKRTTLSEIIFCCEPGEPNTVDEVYAAERTAARDVAFECSLIDFERLVDDDDPGRAVRQVEKSEAVRNLSSD